MKNTSKRLFLIAAGLLAASVSFGGSMSVAAKADEVVSDKYRVAWYSGESSVSYYLDGDSALYVSGSNGSGEFGDGTKGTTRYTPVKIMDNVAAVADGKSGFALALKKDGSLYGWGNNKYAQLGQGTAYNDDAQSNCILTPAEITVPTDSPIVSVAAGDSFSAVLTESGEVYTCGRAGDGQTGIGGLSLNRKTVVGTFTRIAAEGFGGEKIKAIDAAENTGFALSETGRLYVWGANDKGILGSGSLNENDIYETPAALEFSEPISEVSAETMTVMIRTESGRVYGWGDNSVGQLGNAAAEGVAAGRPVAIDKFYEADGTETQISVKEILCGGRTNFVLSDDGRVFAFGAAGKGQAGCNLQSEGYLDHPCVSESNVILPMRVRFNAPISLENASEELLSVYKDKLPVDLTTPAEVSVEKLIGSVGDRTFVRDAQGSTWSWGINLYAMACSGDAFDCTVPVRSTLFRKENYDQGYSQKNYLIKPAVVMSCVVAFAVGWFAYAEIKIRRTNKRLAKEESLRRERENDKKS